MKIVAWILGVLLVGGGVAFYVMRDSRSSADSRSPSAAAKREVPATLAKGTPIRLMLLKPLDSGGSEVGESVPLLVAEDIKSPSGHVVVRRGALAYAKVTQSRAAGALSGMLNQPARLAIELERTYMVDQNDVRLSASVGERGDSTYALNRDNTGLQPSSQGVKELLDAPETRDAVVKLAELMAAGRASEFGSSDEGKKLLAEVAAKCGLKETQKLVDHGDVAKALSLADAVHQATNGDLTSSASADTVLAVIELARVVQSIGGSLFDRIKGRNIRAHIGTPIQAYLGEEARVMVRQ